MTIRDDEALRDEFASKVASPALWLEAARDAYASAKALEIGKRDSGTFAPGYIHETDFCWLMLVAFAVENLLKAAVVALDPTATREATHRTGKLPKTLDDHSLFRLAQAAGIDIDKRNEHELRRLTAMAEWAGRYPLPRTMEEFRGDVRTSNNETMIPAYAASDDREPVRLLRWIQERIGLSCGA